MCAHVRRQTRRSTLSRLARWLTATTIPALLLSCACTPAPPVSVAFIANAGNNHLQVLDLESGETLRKIYAGASPWRLELSPDRRQIWAQHWYSGHTAVVDLKSGEIRKLLPYRGPGRFSADGTSYLTFDWPRSELFTLDADTYEVLDERSTQVKQVYDLAPSWEGQSLFLLQHDPMAKGPAPRYGYVLAYDHTAEDPSRAVPASVPTGPGPRRLRLSREPFLLTADGDTNGLTLVNRLGARRQLAACAGPREILLSPDESRAVVLCWLGSGARESQALSFRTDFQARPWPKMEPETEKTFRGALVAGAFSAQGDKLYLIEQQGRELLEVEPATLDVNRRWPLGDAAADVVVVEVSGRVRRRLAEGESPSRRRLKELLAHLAQDRPSLAGLAWEETATRPSSEEGGEDTPGTQDRRHRKLRLKLPDALRAEEEDGSIRLSQGGRSLVLDADGRFWITPRQELISTVLALPALTVDEAIRQLAGDVPGSPFLRAGIALDVGVEIEGAEGRFFEVGAGEEGGRLAQLWLDPQTALPIRLVEQFPSFTAGGHGTEIEIAETDLLDYGPTAAGLLWPRRLVRLLEGGWMHQVALGEPTVDPAQTPELFSLAQLAGREAPGPPVFEVTSPSSSPGAAATAAQPAEIVSGPLAPHAPYPTNPPTSGPALPWGADWGIHPVPVPLPLQTHSLLDGGVMIQYRCPEGCPDLVSELDALIGARERLLVAPYPWGSSLLTLTAWGHLETLDELDRERIESFIETYSGRHQHRD